MGKHARALVSTLLATVLFASVGGGIGSAQEVIFAGDLSLSKTYIKTGGALSLSLDDVTEALTPTTIRCPVRPGRVAAHVGAKAANGPTCTLRIELSSQFSNVTPGTVAGASVLVDQSADGIAPSSTAGFDSTSTGGASNVRTFSWVKTGLAPGDHTIQVFLFLVNIDAPEGGSAGSFMRTLTVQVYKR